MPSMAAEHAAFVQSRNFASSASDPSTPVSAVAEISDALDRADALASRLSDTVNRLCGFVGQVTSASDDAKVGIPESTFARLRRRAEMTREALRRADMQLDRLDRETE